MTTEKKTKLFFFSEYFINFLKVLTRTPWSMQEEVDLQWRKVAKREEDCNQQEGAYRNQFSRYVQATKEIVTIWPTAWQLGQAVISAQLTVQRLQASVVAKQELCGRPEEAGLQLALWRIVNSVDQGVLWNGEGGWKELNGNNIKATCRYHVQVP